MRTTTHLLVTIALIGLLVLGACGDDENDSSATFCDAVTNYQAASSAMQFSTASPAELEGMLTELQHRP
jgi:hypothetical protein